MSKERKAGCFLYSKGIRRKYCFVKNVLATGMFKKSKLRKSTLNSGHRAKKALTVAVSSSKRGFYISSSEFSEPMRFRTTECHCYNQNICFIDRIDQNVDKYRTGIQMKKWRWSHYITRGPLKKCKASVKCAKRTHAPAA